MQENSVIEIIKLCTKIDETARDIYAKLARMSDSEDLSAFWSEMASEESEHVHFWKRAAKSEAVSGLPDLFDNPKQVVAELEKALSRTWDLLARCEENFSVSNAFMLAYRMEFYLLHPAFEVLFNILGPTIRGANPKDNYESHIVKFLKMVGTHGNMTPELELLGEVIERLWKENRHLALQSTRDELTGVLNRRGFFTFSVQFAYLAQRTRSILAIMMIDIDHFKSINDRLGHAAGDRVLRGTARLLTEKLRTSDLLGRYGGEEFIVLLSDIKSGSTTAIAEGIRKTVEEARLEGISFTVSIGFSEAVLGRDVRGEYQQLIQKADAALYQAKDAGRNRVVEYKVSLSPPNTP